MTITHSDSIVALMKATIEAGLMKPGEFWRALPQFPEYLIGAHGAVISLVGRPRQLRPISIGKYDGYQLRSATGRREHVYRHRLVAEAFHGPAPDGTQCRHLDGDRSNADITNLRWGTPAENAADKRLHGTHRGSGKLSLAAARAMRAKRAGGATYRAIAQEYGVSTMTAYRAVVGQSWSDA